MDAFDEFDDPAGWMTDALSDIHMRHERIEGRALVGRTAQENYVVFQYLSQTRILEKTLKKASEATIVRSYDPAVLGISIGMFCFGTYFYLKYKK